MQTIEDEINMKPNYLIDELVSYYKNKDFKNLDKVIINCFIEILENSEKYLFHNLFENFIYEMSDPYSDEPFIKNIEFFKSIHSIEFTNPTTNIETIICFVNFKHPLFKKLINILGMDYTISKDENVLVLYFEKNNKNEWMFPYKTIYIKDDGEWDEIKIFNKPKNLDENTELNEGDILKSLLGGLFDLCKSIIKTFNNNNEYVFIPPIYKSKYNKGYVYKINQTFLRKPKNNLKNNQGISMSIKNKNKIFESNKQKIEKTTFIR